MDVWSGRRGHMRRAGTVVLMMASSFAIACVAQGGRHGAAPTPVTRESPPIHEQLAPRLATSTSPSASAGRVCAGCASSSFTRSEQEALSQRIAELKAKGAPCATYANVLENAIRSGLVTVRPYMWRVAGQLASGEAHADGAIYVAREIDSLNVGLRPFSTMLWSMEHEAAHLALNLDSPLDRVPSDRADDVVRACHS